MTRQFAAAAVFDWSGAVGERLPGMALAIKQAGKAPALIEPPGGWSRARALAWIEARIAARDDILIGLDVSVGLPFLDTGAYFPGWDETPATARALWALVERHATDEPHFAANAFVAHAEAGRYFRQTGRLGDRYGAAPGGRLRRVEIASREAGLANPYCSLNLVGAAQVGKASLTAMRLLHRLAGRIAIWPMDPLPAHGPAIVEIYTSIAAVQLGLPKGRSKVRSRERLEALFAAVDEPAPPLLARYDDHATDALITAAWLHRAQRDPGAWRPRGLDRHLAQTEGWTFGVT
ncbi:hypothetical protein [Novosphingobium lentum]|uniref:hypothetical protein n=1 Tax=Novosphingobium lentum TaxID=145287 RepID=UPI0008371FAB|nr:hypothetical protein [Novosphingobium lentum]